MRAHAARPSWLHRMLCDASIALCNAWRKVTAFKSTLNAQLQTEAALTQRLARAEQALQPYLHWDWAHPCHICAGTGLIPATSAPRLGWRAQSRHCSHSHICTGTPATPAPRELGSPLPRLHRDPCHTCA